MGRLLSHSHFESGQLRILNRQFNFFAEKPSETHFLIFNECFKSDEVMFDIN